MCLDRGMKSSHTQGRCPKHALGASPGGELAGDYFFQWQRQRLQAKPEQLRSVLEAARPWAQRLCSPRARQHGLAPLGAGGFPVSARAPSARGASTGGTGTPALSPEQGQPQASVVATAWSDRAEPTTERAATSQQEAEGAGSAEP